MTFIFPLSFLCKRYAIFFMILIATPPGFPILLWMSFSIGLVHLNPLTVNGFAIMKQ